MVRPSSTGSVPTTDPAADETAATTTHCFLRSPAASTSVLDGDQLDCRFPNPQDMRPVATRRREEGISRGDQRPCLRLVLGHQRSKVVIVDVKVGSEISRVRDGTNQIKHMPHSFTCNFGFRCNDKDRFGKQYAFPKQPEVCQSFFECLKERSGWNRREQWPFRTNQGFRKLSVGRAVSAGLSGARSDCHGGCVSEAACGRVCIGRRKAQRLHGGRFGVGRILRLLAEGYRCCKDAA